MLQLKNSTSSKVQLITSTGEDIDVHVSYIDFTSPSTFAPDTDDIHVTTATTTDIVVGTASAYRNVRHLSFRNIGTSTNKLTILHIDATDTVEMIEVTLSADEYLMMNGEGTWFVYDVNGGVKTGAPAASDTVAGSIAIALQADQETGTSTTLAVTPGRQAFHPSACKFWCQTTGAASQVIGVSYNVTSIADTATGRMTVTIATDFSSANWCCQVAIVQSATSGDEMIADIDSKAAGTVEVGARIITPAFAEVLVGYDVLGFGDQ